ncbi:uncharacterized protein LAJ45_08321 [Morchella importuna]|uniref:uncharacterized protein n=1 Tax=Morchella importuna TaxID=1174673 RepID=UPI001E8CD9DF|nr:uncharacterized protein LAJ45_08321 [Morchella importuna]KAH8147494.1 hypothetical protein LAJ45_08321 [Morchella importuna]
MGILIYRKVAWAYENKIIDQCLLDGTKPDSPELGVLDSWLTGRIPITVVIMASACCVQGTLQNDSPNGTVTVIHGLDTYVASGDSSKGVIVIIPDVFGWLLINTRLLADVYARKTGLSVYVPDFMFGDSFPVENMQVLSPVDGTVPTMTAKVKTLGKLGAWMFRHREAVSWKIINGFFEAIHKENTTRKVFVSGFCWGGRYACLLAQREKWLLSDRTYREGGLVDAVFAAHPSLLAIPKDIELIAKPVSFAMAEEDERLPMKDVEKIIEILGKQKMFKSEVVTYDGAKHGFALRGNIEIQAQRENMENSQDQAVNWFKQYLD